MLVGIDLDNTIINYDDALYRIAFSRKVIGETTPVNKRAIRDEVRLKFGDVEWQKLQAAIYGHQISEASLMEGVWEFCRNLKKAKHDLVIVSHKTRYPNLTSEKVDLRQAALKFLTEKKFFLSTGLSMKIEDVYFLSTRRAKVEMISDLKCDVFVDDLVEVFNERAFPTGVKKILFSPDGNQRDFSFGEVCRSFREVGEYLRLGEG